MKTLFLGMLICVGSFLRTDAASILIEPVKSSTWIIDTYRGEEGHTMWDLNVTAVDEDIYLGMTYATPKVTSSSNYSILYSFIDGGGDVYFGPETFIVKEGDTKRFYAYAAFALEVDGIAQPSLVSVGWGKDSFKIDQEYKFEQPLEGNALFLQSNSFVPEPSTIGLIAISSLILVRRKR
jgi:hypothetical protein